MDQLPYVDPPTVRDAPTGRPSPDCSPSAADRRLERSSRVVLKAGAAMATVFVLRPGVGLAAVMVFLASLRTWHGGEGDVTVEDRLVIDAGGTVNPQTLAERGASVFLPAYPADQIGMVQFFADPTATRMLVEALACAVRFARGSEYGSETAPLVLTGFSAGGGPASHVALAGESFDRVWEAYEESGGGPPAQYDCTASEASSRVDGFVGIAGAYDLFVGYEGKYGRDFLLEHEPDLWETLWGTVGLHPELRVRLIHGESDSTIPLENSVAFGALLAEAGYDVDLVEFAGGHATPDDLAVETIMELVE